MSMICSLYNFCILPNRGKLEQCKPHEEGRLCAIKSDTCGTICAPYSESKDSVVPLTGVFDGCVYRCDVRTNFSYGRCIFDPSPSLCFGGRHDDRCEHFIKDSTSFNMNLLRLDNIGNISEVDDEDWDEDYDYDDPNDD